MEIIRRLDDVPENCFEGRITVIGFRKEPDGNIEIIKSVDPESSPISEETLDEWIKNAPSPEVREVIIETVLKINQNWFNNRK